MIILTPFYETLKTQIKMKTRYITLPSKIKWDYHTSAIKFGFYFSFQSKKLTSLIR